MQDAAEVMQLLLKVQTEQGDEFEDDDPQVKRETKQGHCFDWLIPVDILYD